MNFSTAVDFLLFPIVFSLKNLQKRIEMNLIHTYFKTKVCFFMYSVWVFFCLFKLQELVHRLWNIQLTGFDLWRNLWTVGNKDQVCGPIYKSLPLPDRLYSAHSSIKVTGWFLIGIFRYVILRHNICVFVEIGSWFL